MGKFFYVSIILFLVAVGCNKEKNSSEYTQPRVSQNNISAIRLIEKVVFNKENQEVFLPGPISAFEVDQSGNVCIASTKPGNVGIYIFNPEGEFVKKIGRYGRGPGDFEAITSLTLDDKNLYAFDSRLQKIAVFSLNNYKHVEDYLLDTRALKVHDEFTRLMRWKDIFSIQGDEFLLTGGVELLTNLNKLPFIRFYRINPSGKIDTNYVAEVPRYKYYNEDGFANEAKTPFTTPFTRTSRTAVSPKGYIYTSWTEDINIQRINIKTGLTDTISFPFNNAKLELSQIELSGDRAKTIKEKELPEYWPALYTLEIDDYEQLWVSTITASDSNFNWFVVGESGDVRGRFTLAGNRADNFVRVKPRFKIKNGYFYQHQYDYSSGIDQIVRYQISYSKELE
ncbi:MAG TPA: hypothetical protein DEQ34_08090 [Balneolaceae bacterium]|nr:hypothetical protein [Balneolaceae bacterium]|tara:strand:+ start:2126 stop:3313 length:1188 start_codon:yes stop_codon:yes gene_type:complete